jgi:hypothetical protein
MCWIAPAAAGGVGTGLAVGAEGDVGLAVGLAVGFGVEVLGPAVVPVPDPEGVESGVAEPEAPLVDPPRTLDSGEVEPVAAGPPAGRGSRTSMTRMAMTTDKAPMIVQRTPRPITLHDRRRRLVNRYPRGTQPYVGPGQAAQAASQCVGRVTRIFGSVVPDQTSRPSAPITGVAYWQRLPAIGVYPSA